MSDPPPARARRQASHASDLRDLIPFSEYMDRVLFDPGFGFYGSGKLRLGHGFHYWTWPTRLHPFFGWMVAETACQILRSLVDSGRVPDGAPLHILELGPGDATLAADVLDRLAFLARDPAWSDLIPRVRYVLMERSPALRSRQAERLADAIAAGRAEVRQVDAQDLQWEGPFHGLVFANELLTVLPAERLVLAPGPRGRLMASRVFVQTWDPSGRPISPEALWERMRADQANELTFSEVLWPLERGWDAEGTPLPTELPEYLESLRPMVNDLKVVRLRPADLHYPPTLDGFVSRLADLLTRPGNAGVACFVDYGGTSRHVIDPLSLGPHLRIYTGDPEQEHRDLPYYHPGLSDITFDLDFTLFARLAANHGIEMHHFGHQSWLENDRLNLDRPEIRSQLLGDREAEGYPPGEVADGETDFLVQRFREAPGFRTAILGPPGFRLPREPFGPSDSLVGEGLCTLARGIRPTRLDAALGPLGVDAPGQWLFPGSDIVANLSDFRCYAQRHAVMDALRSRGWLREPGCMRRQKRKTVESVT